MYLDSQNCIIIGWKWRCLEMFMLTWLLWTQTHTTIIIYVKQTSKQMIEFKMWYQLTSPSSGPYNQIHIELIYSSQLWLYSLWVHTSRNKSHQLNHFNGTDEHHSSGDDFLFLNTFSIYILMVEFIYSRRNDLLFYSLSNSFSRPSTSTTSFIGSVHSLVCDEYEMYTIFANRWVRMVNVTLVG